MAKDAGSITYTKLFEGREETAEKRPLKLLVEKAFRTSTSVRPRQLAVGGSRQV